MKKFLSVLMTGVCTVACAFGLAACGGAPEEPAHTHDYKWVDNGDGTHKQHCQSSGCDAPDINKGNHDFTNGDCVCGAKKPHTHNWSLTYTEEGDRHYQTCDGCTEKKYGDHNYGTDGVCVCGKEKPVTTVAVTGVTLNKDSITLETGGTETLTATVAPENATNKTVTWESDKPDIATVDNTGKVTAIADGTATITATADGKSATCAVTVNAPLTNAQVLKYLNDNYLFEVVKSLGGEEAETHVKNTSWYITKDRDSISSANLIFTYERNVNSNYIGLCKIDFSSPLTPQKIKLDDIETFTCTEIYGKLINPQTQTEHAALTNAICDKVFGTTESEVNARYIIKNGHEAANPKLGDTNHYIVIEVSNGAIKENSIAIKSADTDAEIIEKLNNENNFYTYDEFHYDIMGTKLLNNDEKF